MTFRCPRVSALTGLFLSISTITFAQAPAPTPATAAQTATPVASTAPDYPDPRTFEIGLFYWLTGPGPQPNLETGRGATDYETLTGLGRVHRTPGLEASMPITRTGSLHIEIFETKGSGNQTATVANDLFTTTINAGDYLATQYQIRSAKIYLDDLLFPHKFPVSRLRFKSIWALEYVGVHANINAPYVTAGETADGSSNIVLPVFGLAAEYALSKHILFRLDGSGFGIYHRSDLWDAAATLSWRASKHIEVFAGGKALHFKGSPHGTEYEIGTLDGAFAGARWHL